MTKKYALGHSKSELKRLTTQAKLIDPITERFFRSAGISEGMRVLDVGSGAGDVAFLTARIVGENGVVVGTDKSADALASARLRADALGLANIAFENGDPSELVFDEPFDAIVGRYVLQFVPEPAEFLSRLSRNLRPNGVVAFHELDWGGARSSPPVLTYDACCRWCAEAIGRLGAETRMGAKLHSLFVDAGLCAPTMRLEAVIGSGTGSVEVVALVTELVDTLIEDIERLGIESRANIDLPSINARVLAEVTQTGATVFGRAEVGAWTTRT